jgi:hypothetical protein
MTTAIDLDFEIRNLEKILLFYIVHSQINYIFLGNALINNLLFGKM